MSGRGCTITVQVIGGCRSLNEEATVGVDNNRTENLTLPVALHSPLSVNSPIVIYLIESLKFNK